MDDRRDLAQIARSVIESNFYMTLATADGSGRPWASPVWYAHAGYREFFWVSSPEATHSRNLAARPRISAVIFDSRAPAGEGQAVYMAAVAGEVEVADLDRSMEIFSRASVAGGAREWTPEEVRPPALHRLYRARVSEHWVLDPSGHPVHGRTLDHRTPVNL